MNQRHPMPTRPRTPWLTRLLVLGLLMLAQVAAQAGPATEAWRQQGAASADGDQLLRELGASVEADRIRLTLSDDILFKFNSSEIQPGAAVQLGKIAEIIRKRSVGQVYLVGYTDSIGSDEHNLKLSGQRADAVSRWLNTKEGIPASVLVTRGLGSKAPVAPNVTPDGKDNPSGRARNRRVEVLVATRSGVDFGASLDALVQGAEKLSATGIQGMALEDSLLCKVGQSCKKDCPGGNCTMRCEQGSQCTYSCDGGDCAMSCAAGATCNFACRGGNCLFTCAAGASCTTSCKGGDCSGG